MCLVCSVAQLCLFAAPWTVACQAPLPMEFFRQEILEWVAIFYSRRSAQPRDQTLISWISRIGRWILYHCSTWEAQHKC